jgi:hypothetical protein
MNPEQIVLRMPLTAAFDKIVDIHKASLTPVCIVRPEDPPKIIDFRIQLEKRRDTFLLKLGYATSMQFIGKELLLRLDPEFDRSKLSRRLPHDTATLQLQEKIKALPFNPIIVIDNCQYLEFPLIFRVLRMINELEGMAMFVFLLSGLYEDEWNRSLNPRLIYFFKIVKRYAIE